MMNDEHGILGIPIVVSSGMGIWASISSEPGIWMSNQAGFGRRMNLRVSLMMYFQFTSTSMRIQTQLISLITLDFKAKT